MHLFWLKRALSHTEGISHFWNGHLKRMPFPLSPKAKVNMIKRLESSREHIDWICGEFPPMILHEIVSLYVQYFSCRWVAVVEWNAIYPRLKGSTKHFDSHRRTKKKSMISIQFFKRWIRPHRRKLNRYHWSISTGTLIMPSYRNKEFSLDEFAWSSFSLCSISFW